MPFSKYFTLEELNKDGAVITPEISANLIELMQKMDIVREAYGKPMHVTSGLRSMQKHLEIYKAKGITDLSKIPMKSCHLRGQAVDIADADGALKAWTLANVKVLEDAGLWCESFDATPTWQHYQSVPPKSGNRFFKP